MKYSAHLGVILLDRTNPGSHVAIGPYGNRPGDVCTTIETPLEGIRGGQKGLCIFWGGAKDGTWSPEQVLSACHQCTAYGDEPIGVLGKETRSVCPMCPPSSAPWLLGRQSRAGVGCTRSLQSLPRTVSSSPKTQRSIRD